MDRDGRQAGLERLVAKHRKTGDQAKAARRVAGGGSGATSVGDAGGGVCGSGVMRESEFPRSFCAAAAAAAARADVGASMDMRMDTRGCGDIDAQCVRRFGACTF